MTFINFAPLMRITLISTKLAFKMRFWRKYCIVSMPNNVPTTPFFLPIPHHPLPKSNANNLP